MYFALLLSKLPHVEESRSHYDAMLSLRPPGAPRIGLLWQRLKGLVS
ncbi:hypothetical protein [Burkholderia sp. WAC0059]|nr:hypothetical protein [Burkholderia sp. WAC0059]